MKQLYGLCIGVLLTATWVASASAQIPGAGAGVSGPVVNMGYAGLITGMGSVTKTSAVIGGEAGARVWKNLDVFIEGGSIGDVVPQSQIDRSAPLTDFLQRTQGKTAVATVKMPAVYWGLGARWVFENLNLAGWARPYAQFAAGGGKMERQPTFTVDGQNITNSLASYGVVLGSDMTADEKGAAVSGGFGVVIPYRIVYGDVGYRVTSLHTSGNAITVNRFHVGVGVRF